MAIRSRRLTPVVSKTGVEVSEIYCRKCMKKRAAREFFIATDKELDSNGYMSVCIDCINEMFNLILNAEGNIEMAVLKMCRKLNMKYSPDAIDAAKRHIETIQETGKSIPPFFSIYKLKLTVTAKGQFESREDDLSYDEVTSIVINNDNAITLNNLNEDEIDREVIEFWGEGFEHDEYRWLEKMLGEWKKTHKSDTMAEQVLLRYIVLTQFEIEKARQEKGKATASMLKELQDLMRTAALDPSKANALSSGKSQDTFGAFIKMIEEQRPAEYYKDKELFKDFDNIERYFKLYVVRPLKNFITGSRDFSLEDVDEAEEEFDVDAVVDTSLGENTESEV